jgi:peptidoglycan/xylan/chitin deacetylase (PgdA/CDA1 family)
MLKRFAFRALSWEPVARSWTCVTRDRVTIFMLHRFRLPGLSHVGHEPVMVEALLAHFRRHRYQLISLEDAVERLRDPVAPLSRAVVFTVDDGYADFAEAGAEAFLAYDCPVTVFVTTGLIDGVSWQWWDQIEHACTATTKRAISVRLDGATHEFVLESDRARRAAIEALNLHAWHTTDAMRPALIHEVARSAEVLLPTTPPSQYAGMSWSTIAGLERRGIRFGPHTLTHPVLPSADARSSAREIEDSWFILRQRLANPAPIFAYPHGQFGPREVTTLKRLGLIAAVTTRIDQACRTDVRSSPNGIFALPRIGLPFDVTTARLVASGFERLKRIVRGQKPVKG